MPTTRRRRIVRRAVIAGMLLSVLYVGNYLTLHWLYGGGYIGPAVFDACNSTLYVPMRLYASSDLPGAYTLRAAAHGWRIWGENRRRPI